MNFKTYTSLIIISFSSGFFTCFYTSRPHKVYQNEIHSDLKYSETEKKTEKLSNSRIISRTYNKGNLEKEIITEFEQKSKVSTNNVSIAQKLNKIEQKFTPLPQKNWILGVSAPIALRPSFESTSVQIGHRFIGNTYLYVSADSKLKTTAGVIFSF